MFDAKKLLDAVIGAAAQAGQPAATGQGQGRPPAVGQPADQLLKVAKSVLAQHPGLAQAAAVGLAGLLFGKRKPGRGVTGSLAKLGGLAVIGGLAYKAWQNAQAGKPLLDLAGAPAARQGGAPPAARPASADAAAKPRETFHALEVPQGSGFDPVAQTDDDALLYLRAMVAAATADGQVDAAERERITRGLAGAGLDPQATSWLETQLAEPADVEELAAAAETPEKAAQVYAAARIAIDPDTIQEREFLRLLAEALSLDPGLREQIDTAAGAMQD